MLRYTLTLLLLAFSAISALADTFKVWVPASEFLPTQVYHPPPYASFVDLPGPPILGAGYSGPLRLLRFPYVGGQERAAVAIVPVPFGVSKLSGAAVLMQVGGSFSGGRVCLPFEVSRFDGKAASNVDPMSFTPLTSGNIQAGQDILTTNVLTMRRYDVGSGEIGCTGVCPDGATLAVVLARRGYSCPSPSGSAIEIAGMWLEFE